MSFGDLQNRPSSTLQPLVDFKRLKKKRMIGRGGMGEVTLYDLNEAGYPSQVVVKTLLNFVRGRDVERLRKEMNILNSLNHQNITKTYGAVEGEFGYGIVLEYIPNGSYVDFFQNFWAKQKKTTELEREVAPLKIRILGEIADAMRYLHEYKPKRILHLDLSTANVLLTGSLHAKLSDFGLSEFSTLTSLRSKSTRVIGNLAGTAVYIAPERLRQSNLRPTTKCDVYSFGILQYIIMTDLERPFTEQNDKLIMYHVHASNLRPDAALVHSSYPDILIDLMKSCWNSDPAERPTFKEIAADLDSIQNGIKDFKNLAVSAQEKIHHCMLKWTSSKTVSEQLTRDTGDSGSYLFSAVEQPTETSCDGTSPVTLPSNDIGNFNSPNAPINTTESPSSTASRTACKQIESSSATEAAKELNAFNKKNFDTSTLLPVERNDSFSSFPSNVKVDIKSAELTANNTEDSMNVVLLPNSSHGTGTNKPGCSRKRFGTLLCVMFLLAAAILATILILKNIDSKKSIENFSNSTSCSSLRQIGNGTYKCSNDSSVNSVCTYTCINSHILEGSNTTVCSNNGVWSHSQPTCVCPKCSIGERCQFSTSWKKAEAVLWSVGEDSQAVQVNYGGHIFTCSTNLYKWNFKWKAICSGDGQIIQCKGWKSSRSSAKQAGANFIRMMYEKQVYPRPCDYDTMDTRCVA